MAAMFERHFSVDMLCRTRGGGARAPLREPINGESPAVGSGSAAPGSSFGREALFCDGEMREAGRRRNGPTRSGLLW